MFNMCGLGVARQLPPAAFFWQLFMVWLLCVVFISMSQLAAAAFSAITVAQATIGGFLPVFFLFGGLWSPVPSLGWWIWAAYVDPLYYAVSAVVPAQFYVAGGCSRRSFRWIPPPPFHLLSPLLPRLYPLRVELPRGRQLPQLRRPQPLPHN